MHQTVNCGVVACDPHNMGSPSKVSGQALRMGPPELGRDVRHRQFFRISRSCRLSRGGSTAVPSRRANRILKEPEGPERSARRRPAVRHSLNDRAGVVKPAIRILNWTALHGDPHQRMGRSRNGGPGSDFKELWCRVDDVQPLSRPPGSPHVPREAASSFSAKTAAQLPESLEHADKRRSGGWIPRNGPTGSGPDCRESVSSRPARVVESDKSPCTGFSDPL